MFKDTYLMRPGYFWCYTCQKPRPLSNPCMHHTGDEPCLEPENAALLQSLSQPSPTSSEEPE